MFAVPVTAETTIGEIRQKVQAGEQSHQEARHLLLDQFASRSGNLNTPLSRSPDVFAALSCHSRAITSFFARIELVCKDKDAWGPLFNKTSRPRDDDETARDPDGASIWLL